MTSNLTVTIQKTSWATIKKVVPVLDNELTRRVDNQAVIYRLLLRY